MCIRDSDCSLFELTGRSVQLTQGDYANLKITTRENLPRPVQKEETRMRIGPVSYTHLVAAFAGVHGGHQLEMAGVGGAACGPAHGDLAVLQRLAQHL